MTIELGPLFLGDGCRAPRTVQKDYLNHLRKNWDKFSVFGANLPPGYGKTYIGRTIQRQFGKDCMIITVSNQLLDQFIEDYPEVNAVKGMEHYKTKKEYQSAISNATNIPSIANPLSYYYGVISGRIKKPKYVVIDEAHKLYDTMFLAAYMDFSVSDLNIPAMETIFDLKEWSEDLKDKCESRLNQLSRLSDYQQNEFLSIYEKICLLTELCGVGGHKITFDFTYAKINKRVQQVLRITPISLTKDLFKPFLGEKTLLMSGTFTKHDLNIYDRYADYYSGEYLTKIENRRIKYKPVAQQQRKCPVTLANAILSAYEAEGKPNTVVHVTYDMATKLAPLLPDAITHTKHTKQNAIDRFKLDGGLFLASGCAEGVDLPDDKCRLVIIPVLLYPNLGEEFVRKKKALPEGVFRYNLDTMMTTVQQLGRGTRHATDACFSYVFDPLFSLLYQQTFTHLPNPLNIDWTSR